MTFPTFLLSTLFGGWVLPRLEEASRVEGNGICSASELTFDSGLWVASVLWRTLPEGGICDPVW